MRTIFCGPRVVRLVVLIAFEPCCFTAMTGGRDHRDFDTRGANHQQEDKVMERVPLFHPPLPPTPTSWTIYSWTPRCRRSDLANDAT
eukprot:scaffold57995_cov28-Tisochrysis_lutea.AAC.1